jgi:MFS family permease
MKKDEILGITTLKAGEQADKPSAAGPLAGKAIAASILGNTLEVFDFVSFAFFAVYIGKAFFPTYSSFGQLILAVATFGVGSIARPLGGIVIGAYSDRAGRKAALTLTIGLMAVSTAGVGLTPDYQTIGAAAPLLILFARLIQGFSAGGELGASTTYLIEMAPADRRGYFASWQFASQGFGTVIAALFGYLLALMLTPEQIQNWGWRIPFLFGVLIAPVGMYIRSHLDDTLDATEKHGAAKQIFGQLLRHHRLDILWACCALVSPTVSYYIVSSYMTTYAMTVLKLPTSTSMLAGIVAGIVTVVGALCGGRLVDRFGRKKMGIGALVAFMLMIYPAFLIVSTARSAIVLLAMIAVLTAVRMTISTVALSLATEAFPKAVRTTGLSLGYNLATTVFGGTAQVVVTLLIRQTGSPTSPAWYLLGVSFISLIGLVMLKASKPAGTLA